VSSAAVKAAASAPRRPARVRVSKKPAPVALPRSPNARSAASIRRRWWVRSAFAATGCLKRAAANARTRPASSAACSAAHETSHKAATMSLASAASSRTHRTSPRSPYAESSAVSAAHAIAALRSCLVTRESLTTDVVSAISPSSWSRATQSGPTRVATSGELRRTIWLARRSHTAHRVNTQSANGAAARANRGVRPLPTSSAMSAATLAELRSCAPPWAPDPV